VRVEKVVSALESLLPYRAERKSQRTSTFEKAEDEAGGDEVAVRLDEAGEA